VKGEGVRNIDSLGWPGSGMVPGLALEECAFRMPALHFA
jgi:hypothetical protein